MSHSVIKVNWELLERLPETSIWLLMIIEFVFGIPWISCTCPKIRSFSSWKRCQRKPQISLFLDLLPSWNQCVKSTKKFADLLSDRTCLFRVFFGFNRPCHSKHSSTRTLQYFVLNWYPTGLSSSFHAEDLLGLFIWSFMNFLSSW